MDESGRHGNGGSPCLLRVSNEEWEGVWSSYAYEVIEPTSSRFPLAAEMFTTYFVFPGQLGTKLIVQGAGLGELFPENKVGLEKKQEKVGMSKARPKIIPHDTT